jgi:rhodanese-related sulfurtransferase
MTYSEEPVNDYRQVLGTDGQLVDVREPAEFAAGTLPGATNIPLGELPSRLSELDRDRRVVLLCRSGGRSANAAAFLANSGFADVVNLTGGMLAAEPSQ